MAKRIAAVWVLVVGLGYFASAVLPAEEGDYAATSELVGRSQAERIVLPVNQVLTPWGRQIELPGMRPQAIALSPNGRRLVVSGKTSELVVIDPDTAEVAQRVPLPPVLSGPGPTTVSPNILNPDKPAQMSYTGLVFARDGKTIFFSDVTGTIRVFTVTEASEVHPQRTIILPPAGAPRRDEEIPSGLALSPDGTRLYVCANLSNRVHEIDLPSGRVLRSFHVGVAPYDVVLVGDRLFVSNWGGRRPGAGDLTGPAGRGTVVRVDPVRHIAKEGSVSIIPLADPARTTEVITGLHASGLAVSPDGMYVVC
jgi:DNA-binding beta-propeller fold protein YncE